MAVRKGRPFFIWCHIDVMTKRFESVSKTKEKSKRLFQFTRDFKV